MSQLITDLQQDSLKNVYKDQNISYVGLFGSFARGEEIPSSDVDILIDFNESKTLFDLANIKIIFQDTLGKKVDLVLRDSVKKMLKPYIEKDLITIYEQN